MQKSLFVFSAALSLVPVLASAAYVPTDAEILACHKQYGPHAEVVEGLCKCEAGYELLNSGFSASCSYVNPQKSNRPTRLDRIQRLMDRSKAAKQQVKPVTPLQRRTTRQSLRELRQVKYNSEH